MSEVKQNIIKKYCFTSPKIKGLFNLQFRKDRPIDVKKTENEKMQFK